MNIIFDAKILHKLIFLLVVVTCVFGCIRLMCELSKTRTRSLGCTLTTARTRPTLRTS